MSTDNQEDYMQENNMQEFGNGSLDKLEKRKDHQKKSIWSINKEMLPYKMHFFLFNGAMSATIPYLPVFAKTRIGISATSLGVLSTAQQFLSILAKLVIGYLVDYLNKLKAIIVILTTVQGIFVFMLLTIPKIEIKEVDDSNNSTVFFNTEFYQCELYFRKDPKSILSVFSCNEFSQSNSFEDSLCPEMTNVSDGHYSMVFLLCNGNLSERQDDLTEKYENAMNFTITNELPTPNSVFICSPNSKHSNFSIYSDSEYGDNWCYDGANKLHLLDMMHLLNDSTQPPYFIYSKQKENDTISDYAVEQELSAVKEINIYHTYQFWLFSLYLIIINLAITSLFTLADTACYESLQNTGAEYGRQRLWGAISWGVLAPFAGFLNDYTEGYLAPWCLMAAVCGLLLWNLSRMNLTKPHFSQNILKDIGEVFSSSEFIAFEVGVFMNGVSFGFIWFYLSWFIESIGGSRLLIGLAQCIQCFCGELPFMFYAGWIINKVGHFNVVSISLLAHSVRFFWYSYLRDPWMLLPIECIHGLTYGVFVAAVTSYAKISAKPGTEATTQSVLCTTYEGLGAGVGSIIAGIGFDRLGGQMTFYYAGIIWAFASGINVISTLVIKRRKRIMNVTSSTSALTITVSHSPTRY